MCFRVVVLISLCVPVAVSGECQDAACAGLDTDRVSLLQSSVRTVSVLEATESFVLQNFDLTDSASKLNFTTVFAEFVAMTLFVVIGVGSAMAVCHEPGWTLQVALTFGLAITSLAYTVGHYSGAQINCAVTFGLVVAGKLSMLQGILNFVAQMLGSVTGAIILTAMIPQEKDKTGGLGTNKIAEGISKMNAFLGEFMMTFSLMFVVLETAVNPQSKANREMAAMAIGFAVFLAHSVLISVDGCSINPTRSFGPALVRMFSYKDAGDFSEMWVFWAGPVLGAGVAALLSTQMMG